jgi:AraC-like DNA-binding protein
MTMQSTELASGTGWRVDEVLCSAGPRDRTFEERHDTVAIALVLEGSFQYRTTQGSVLMTPGALMLGNPGACFECGHEHARGDRCLSFHYAPAYWESLVAAVPGARRSSLGSARLPPSRALVPVTATARQALHLGRAALEAAAVDMAATVIAMETGTHATAAVRSDDERRVSEVVRYVEAHAHELESEGLSLAALGRLASLSPYHFLRTFRGIVGMSPHQYLIRQRLEQAAVRLVASDLAISRIALDAGFGDLSTFNRQFRGAFGMTPRRYRQTRARARVQDGAGHS